MKICKECGVLFGGINVYRMSKYCGDGCRSKVRSRVNASCKNNAKKRIENRDIDFIATSYFKKYRQGSPRRELEFSLTLDFFKRNVYAPCYYCGEEIKAVGFDRLDNSVGYIESNSVPCCIECNFMKRNLDVAEFVYKCHQIARNIPVANINEIERLGNKIFLF